MRRRSSLLFILINILVSLGVVLIVIALLNNSRQDDQSAAPIVITVPVVITTTPNPNAGPTIIYITATLPPGVVQLPTGLITDLQAASTSAAGLPTQDLTSVALGTASTGQIPDAQAVLPANCISVTLEAGDTPAGLAVEYDVSMFDILAVNGLSEEDATFLQIGQTLIIPQEGCPLTAQALAETEAATAGPTEEPTSAESETPTVVRTPTVTPSTSATPTRTFTPSVTPTATLPPTAANAVVAIVRVVDAGNVTAEAVEIRNNGPIIDLSGWTLRDSEGNAYVFPNDRRLFQGGSLTVFSRVGEDTAIALYWDRQQAAFSRGESVTLTDREGRAQSVYTIP